MLPNFLTSFDIRFETGSYYSDFIKICAELGWSPWVFSGEVASFRLPGATLYGIFLNFEAAYNALESARSATELQTGHNVLMNKRVIVEIIDIGFISDVFKNV